MFRFTEGRYFLLKKLSFSLYPLLMDTVKDFVCYSKVYLQMFFESIRRYVFDNLLPYYVLLLFSSYIKLY